MSVVPEKNNHRSSTIMYTIIATTLIFVVLLSMISFFYIDAEKEANDTLHLQTKQIKDDLTLQIKSDRENLVTMSHFAARLYSDGDDFRQIFDAFEPIGLISNIGILDPNNVFHTKIGSVDLNGKISFDEELKRGEYISGRIPDLTREREEIIRSAVPVTVGDEAVGILYGVIKLEDISEKYHKMAEELDAQLFVYDKESGNFVINTIWGPAGNVSSFDNRRYKDGYSYEALISEPSGFSSFKSIMNGQDMYVHFSTLEDINWGIILARYESQVFKKADSIFGMLVMAFLTILLIVLVYVFYIIATERRTSRVISHASDIRRHLLDINQSGNNICEALERIATAARSDASFMVDVDGEEFFYRIPEKEAMFSQLNDTNKLMLELFHHSAMYYKKNNTTVGFQNIKADNQLEKDSKSLYDIMVGQGIREISFSYVAKKNNHICVIGVANPQDEYTSRAVLEDVAVCFSIALYNKKYLRRTETAATTDSLTGADNRVAYIRDIVMLDEEKPDDFTCIYIDVNELHLRNNRYGHAAGDAMLIYIANTLKEIFYGHYIYRMGGDEFLVFVKGEKQEKVNEYIAQLIAQLKTCDYNVAIGTSYRKQNPICEDMVREAEVRMYEAKAEYYQSRESTSFSKDSDGMYAQVKTGILEIDTLISIMKDHYNGIYRVSLEKDEAHRILMPSYFGYSENESNFSGLYMKYVNDSVHPDYRRAAESFLNYDAIRHQMAEGNTPRITYKKMNGEMVVLSVHQLGNKDDIDQTLWVFAKA